jgi:hypothetical protein
MRTQIERRSEEAEKVVRIFGKPRGGSHAPIALAREHSIVRRLGQGYESSQRLRLRACFRCSAGREPQCAQRSAARTIEPSEIGSVCLE